MSAPISVTVKADLAGLNRVFHDLTKKQISFATALAWTRSAEHGRDAARARFSRAFSLRRKNLPQTVIRVPARKSDWPHLKGEVTFTNRSDKRLGFLERQEFGGVKRPKKKAIAIPSSRIKRLKGGGISKTQRPGRLLEKKKHFSRNGKLFRRGQDGNPELLYTFHRGPRIKPVLGFHKAATDEIQKRLESEMVKAMEFALATARR